MIKITLKQFRCWESLELNISLGQITLIKGNSGSGKTTILQALIWCLYGKIQLVAPNQLNDDKKSKQPKTQVSIELPFVLNDVPGHLIINRKKNPNQFTITHNNNCYEDKVAQSMIDDLFGTYDIWLASCYVGQNSRNTFLTAPNAGKMELLNSIAFHEEDPNVFIDKIVTIITEKEAQYKLKLSDFTINIETLKTYLANNDTSKALSVEHLDLCNQKIVTLQNDIEALHLVKQQRDVDMAVLNNLQEQYQQIPIISIPEPDDDLKIMMEKYDGIRVDLPLLYRRDDLLKEIAVLPVFNNDTSFTITDYHDTLLLETTIKDNQQLATMLNIAYDNKEILTTIDKYQNIINLQNLRVLQEKIDTLERDHRDQTIPITVPVVVEQVIAVPDYGKYDCSSLSNLVVQKSMELIEVSKENNCEQTKVLEQKVSMLYQQLLEKIIYQSNDTVINILEGELVTVRAQEIILTSYQQYEKPIEELSNKLRTLEITPADQISHTISTPDYTVYDKQKHQEQLQKLSKEQNELKTHIQYLQLGQDILSCPKCNNPLRYHQCTLIPAERDPATSAELLDANDKFSQYTVAINQLTKYIEELGTQEQIVRRNYELQLQKNKQDQISKINIEIMNLTKEMQTIKLNEQQELEKKKREHILQLTNKIQAIKMDEQRKFEAIRQARDNKINAEIAELNNEIKRLITLANNERQLRIDELNKVINQTKLQIQQLQASEHLERMKYETAVREEQTRIANLKRMIVQMEEEQSRRNLSIKIIEKQIIDHKQQLALLPPVIDSVTLQKVLSATEVEQIVAYINRLKDIKILATPVHNSNYIKQCLSEQEIKKKRVDLANLLDQHLLQIPFVLRDEAVTVINNYLDKLQKYTAVKTELTNKKVQMETMRDGLVEKIALLRSKIGMDDPIIQIELNREKILQLQQKVEEGIRANETIAYHDKMQKERESLTILSTELGELQLLKQYAVDTESKSLQDVVVSINNSISEVCETLFDKDINIVLNLFKTVKSTKNVKPQINFTISYKGGSFDNINQMSGGEGDRASIALTLALNRLSSFPILMLDESLSSLDLDMKEATVDTISKTIIYDQHKQQKINRAVVIIMHDGIEGIFDNVINIDDINDGRY